MLAFPVLRHNRLDQRRSAKPNAAHGWPGRLPGPTRDSQGSSKIMRSLSSTLSAIVAAGLLTACSGNTGLPTSVLPRAGAQARVVPLMPTVRLYDGWPVTPAWVYAPSGCYLGVPQDVTPHAAPVSLTSSGICNSAQIGMSSLNKIVMCIFTVTSSGVSVAQSEDTQCRRVKLADGSFKLIYNLKENYRPHH
jgi:hypothetical protein